MKLFSRFLPLLALALPAFVVSAHAAQTVAIIDNLASSTSGSVAQHDPIGHWEGFSTTLSASVNYPPPPISETKIVGPTFIWSGETSQIQRSSNQGQTISLQSVFPPTAALPAGDNNITINCSATYTRNNSDDQPIEQISVPASSITVKFWSRVPAFVKQIEKTPGKLSDVIVIDPLSGQEDQPSPFYGPSWWGHADRYHLQIQDNQPSPLPYGYGKAHEEFVNVSPADFKPNGDKGPDTWPVGSDFTDIIGVNIHSNTDPNIPFGTLVDEFDQLWHCMESKPPYPSPYDKDTPLNTHHVKNYFYSSTRTGG